MQPRRLRPEFKVRRLTRNDLPRLVLRWQKLQAWQKAARTEKFGLLKKFDDLMDQNSAIFEQAEDTVTKKQYRKIEKNNSELKKIQLELEQIRKKAGRLEIIDRQIKKLDKQIREIQLHSMLAPKK